MVLKIAGESGSQCSAAVVCGLRRRRQRWISRPRLMPCIVGTTACMSGGSWSRWPEECAGKPNCFQIGSALILLLPFAAFANSMTASPRDTSDSMARRLLHESERRSCNRPDCGSDTGDSRAGRSVYPYAPGNPTEARAKPECPPAGIESWGALRVPCRCKRLRWALV